MFYFTCDRCFRPYQIPTLLWEILYSQSLILFYCLSVCLSVRTNRKKCCNFCPFVKLGDFGDDDRSIGCPQNVELDFWFRPPIPLNSSPKFCGAMEEACYKLNCDRVEILRRLPACLDVCWCDNSWTVRDITKFSGRQFRACTVVQSGPLNRLTPKFAHAEVIKCAKITENRSKRIRGNMLMSIWGE